MEVQFGKTYFLKNLPWEWKVIELQDLTFLPVVTMILKLQILKA